MGPEIPKNIHHKTVSSRYDTEKMAVYPKDVTGKYLPVRTVSAGGPENGDEVFPAIHFGG
jgi:hypothetical protein